MAWFSETFGDSLTSLKGQITKITKEVLADDETLNDQESDGKTVKELEAFCASKDLEIASLRSEFEKLQSKYKSVIEGSKNENDGYGNDGPTNSDQTTADRFSQLEAELQQVKEERNHLNTCIDELQAEHQTNLTQVILIRDKYKKELEELNKNYTDLKLKFDESSREGSSSGTMLTDMKKLLEEKNSELTLLRGEYESFKLQVETGDQTKNETLSALQSEVEKCSQLKQELEKLKNDNLLLAQEKQKIEDENRSLKLQNDNLFKKIDSVQQESSTTLHEQLNKLTNEKEELLRKVEEDKKAMLLTINSTEMEEKLKNMFKRLNLEVEEKDTGFNGYLSLIENRIHSDYRKSEETCKKLLQEISHLENQLKTMREQNCTLQNELKFQSDKWTVQEKQYLEDIALANKHLEDVKTSNLKLLEVEKQSEIDIQSQTDDVKRLEQEVVKLLYQCDTKTNELTLLGKYKNELEQELSNLKTISDNNIKEVGNKVEKLQMEINQLQVLNTQLEKEKFDLEEKWSTATTEKASLNKMNAELKLFAEKLEKEVAEVKNANNNILEVELNKSQSEFKQLQNTYIALQKANENLNNQHENLKAQVIVRENSITELMKSNAAFQEEINKLQSKCNELHKCHSELEKWKNVSVELEMQNQDLTAKLEALDGDILKMKGNLELTSAKDAEILQLKQANSNLTESCNRLHQELETKLQAEQIYAVRENEFQATFQKQSQAIAELQEEKAELNSRVQKFQEQMKIQILQNEELSEKAVQQHRRSKSEANFESSPSSGFISSAAEAQSEIAVLKQAIQNEQTKFKELYSQFQVVAEKEGNARKEFERLKEHLIEVEDHYTEQALENEKVINELKGKLMMAEEQLKNSSTLYTSAKIRDNQHVESLQNQVRLITVQRDNYQTKLSAADDEIQRHKASLTSLQIVLEQFQQDKQREHEGLALKHEKQIELMKNSFREYETQIEGLQKQLLEAKNGLKAASRLGEQLEIKTQQVVELEQNLGQLQNKVSELEENLQASNQSVSGKVDKSLIKNLVVGYILSPKADRKSQVLRILASVLDFSPEEREKMGVDATSSGWLASILHPKTGGPPTNESLSEAFIKFLENESRPQPQVKLVPEQYKPVRSRSSSTTTKPHGVFSELVLPTFNSPQENESSIILKNVLKDS